MKTLILLAVFAIASFNSFAGTFNTSRSIARSASDNLSSTKLIADIVPFEAPVGTLFSSLRVAAYAECSVAGNSTDGNTVLATAAYYATVGASWDKRSLINKVSAYDGDVIIRLPYQNIMEHMYNKGNNSLLFYHYILLPAGMYGNMKTFFTLEASYFYF